MASKYVVSLTATTTRPITASKSIGFRCLRCYSSVPEPDLKSTLRQVIPAKRELLKKVRRHEDKTIGKVEIMNTVGGMRQACQLKICYDFSS
ncbi:MAG: hypothetical protein L6R41_003773 [Letrouitia leprolyta]|nr:MAG: hypothetical protein L6R41_003773 [Letrouitia leprolyta]